MAQGTTGSRQIAVSCRFFSDSAVAAKAPGDFSGLRRKEPLPDA
jgi:hypothetical protein